MNPGAEEICGNGLDDDCDGVVDDVGVGARLWYPDLDEDGYGVDAPVLACAAPPRHLADLSDGVDCDDDDPDVHPGADEICGNGIDDDCDTLVDDAGLGAPTWYPDRDQDGYAADEPVVSCARPSLHLPDLSAGVDCNDFNPAINPGAAEIWYDGVDQDCDEADDYDQDGDGYRSKLHTVDGDDCDDTHPLVNPGRNEICDNGLDDDCSGGAPECELHGEVPLDPNPRIAVLSSVFASTAEIFAGDVNGDGVDDLVVRGVVYDVLAEAYEPEVRAFRGPFSSGASSPNTLMRMELVEGQSILAADMSGGGTLDLFVAHREVDVRMYHSPLSGTVSRASYDWRVADITVGRDLLAADMGGVAGKELFIAHRYVGYSVFSPPFAGDVLHASRVGSSPHGFNGFWFEVGDLDGEGDLDVAFGDNFNWGDSYWRVPLNLDGVLRSVDSAAVEDMPTIVAPGISIAMGQAGCLADFDGDGAMDVVVLEGWRNSGTSALNMVLGPFTGDDVALPSGAGWRLGPLAVPPVYPWMTVRLACGDLNGDGLADLAFEMRDFDAGEDQVWLFYGPLDGEVAMVPHAVFPSAGFEDWRSTFIHDLNGDGFGDLIMNGEDGKVIIAFGGGM